MAESTEEATVEGEGDGGSGTDRVCADTRYRGAVWTAFREFLTRPLVLTGCAVVLAAVTLVHDRGVVPWGKTVAGALSAVLPSQAIGTFLSTVTPGVLTVISIIFFVALMCVQHQSSKYSPVVLDQFMRRRINQVFFGTFVGLTIYCLIVLGFVSQSQAVLSGTVALVLSIVTVVLLLVFVYITFDQMRPSSTSWVLQNMALRGRALQAPLLRCSRAESQLRDAPATNAAATGLGYVVDIDGEKLEAALRRAQREMNEVEVELWVGMGAHVVPGSLVAQIRGRGAEQRDRLARRVLQSFTIAGVRDIDRDPAQVVNHLSSMAWSGAVSGDVEGARLAVEGLEGVLMLFRGELVGAEDDVERGSELPLVYADTVDDKIIDGVVNVITASSLSGQHQSAADTLIIVAHLLPNLSAETRALLLSRLERVLPAVSRHWFTVELEDGFARLRQAMHDAGASQFARRLEQIEENLREQHQLASPD